MNMDKTIKLLIAQQAHLQLCAKCLGDIMHDARGLSADDKADLFNCIYDIGLANSRLARLIERLGKEG
jgi:hypothetical protein